MTLAELIEGVPLQSLLLPEWGALDVAQIEYDSRRVRPGALFVAFSGARVDGRAFATAAIAAGAVAVLSELPPPDGFAAPWIQVQHARHAMSAMARRLLGAPDRVLRLSGVTGTNGKTTTVYLLDAMLRAAGRTTGMAGTVLYRVAGEQRPAVNTTPDSLDLLRLMDEVLKAGGTDFSFEVSSHALALGRVSGFSFNTVVFTNLTQDHLDFHGTMEAYFQAKQSLFLGAGGPAPRHAVINLDDPWGRRLATAPETARLEYAIDEAAELRAENLVMGFHGVHFDVCHRGRRQRIESKLCGRFNVYNLLAAYGAGLTLGLEPGQMADALASGPAVPGRFERVDAGQPFLVIVDYAHTPDALENVLRTARALEPKRILTVFGCGGDRDRAKRPLMGAAAARLSDQVIVTSDNPRSEDPLRIIEDALPGLKASNTPFEAIADRAEAIGAALGQARAGDIVVIAGKGHETYQVLADRTIDFDDRRVARSILSSLGYPAPFGGAQ
jgi:UDP-N-acetylmuramoyl-L-alanyl-D-glutamate--2,6-diaminopimelate ligase